MKSESPVARSNDMAPASRKPPRGVTPAEVAYLPAGSVLPYE